MRDQPKPPEAYEHFIATHPHLKTAWEAIAEAGKQGPIDERTQRLLKLAIAAGAMREGAVRSSARKALAMGITPEEIRQVVALAAGVLGLPSTVAVHTWLRGVTAAEPERDT